MVKNVRDVSTPRFEATAKLSREAQAKVNAKAADAAKAKDSK